MRRWRRIAIERDGRELGERSKRRMHPLAPTEALRPADRSTVERDLGESASGAGHQRYPITKVGINQAALRNLNNL